MLMLNIQKYRINKKLTQEELANRIGVSQNYISLLERGEMRKVSPTLRVIEAISDELDVCVHDIINCNCPKCTKERGG